MKATELKQAIESNKIIVTTAQEFFSSSINWSVDNEEDFKDYMVEIYRNDFGTDVISVTFVEENEFRNNVRNTDFSEYIEKDDENDFLRELEDNSEIFTIHR